MTLKVLKFGGSSLADGEHFRKVEEIIKSEDSRRYIVASAPGKRFPDDEKVTDLLYKCFDRAKANINIDEIFTKIENRYNEIIEDLKIDLSLQDEFENIKGSISHNVGLDYIISRGEYLNSLILAKYLGYDFVDAKDIIFFNEDGTLNSEYTSKCVFNKLENHQRAVIPGFYGTMPNGTIKTFSRGGSDITGSLVARGVNAHIYENWTDVSGMLMADPRIVDNPKTIEVITYKELRELSYMGATVLHEDAIFPVKEANIPINIRNTNVPDAKGTMIIPKVNGIDSENIITGIAGKSGFSSINIEKDMMNAELGFGMKVLEVLNRHEVSFEHIPTGIDTMSILVNSASISDNKDAIIANINEAANPDSLIIEDNIAMIAIVGRNMAKYNKATVRIFSAITNLGINIKFIDQGSSQLNIIIGVDEMDYVPALRAIYEEFTNEE